ncbi:unnamed protein product [Withania somnifera]
MPIIEPMNGDGNVRVGVNDIEDVGIVELVGSSSITAIDSSSFRTPDTAESSISISDDQIAPLLTQSERPKINIFTIPYPRQKLNKEEVIRVVEPDKSPGLQFIFWLWSGSRYSGLLCAVLSCTIYSMLDVVSDVFTVQAVPLFEIAFARCTVVLILSFVWLRKSGEPIFAPTSARKLLVIRALSGCLSLLSFIYRLPVLTFALLASPAAAISTFAFENFVLPSLYSFLLMAVLGVLAFFAEVTLARGLQLEKTSRVANIQFIEVALSQFLGMGSSRIIPSFGRLVGCIIILISACCTMYIGPEKEIE